MLEKVELLFQDQASTWPSDMLLLPVHFHERDSSNADKVL